MYSVSVENTVARQPFTYNQTDGDGRERVHGLCIGFCTILLFHFVQQSRFTTATQLESIARSVREPLSAAILKADIPEAEAILSLSSLLASSAGRMWYCRTSSGRCGCDLSPSGRCR